MKERLKNVLHNRKPVIFAGLAGILVCVAISVCLLMNRGDFLRVTRREPCTVVFKTNFGHLVHGGEIRAEMWADGKCIRTAPVDISEDVQEIYVAMRERKEEYILCGMDIEIRTEREDGTSGGSLLSYFPFPEDRKAQGYGWNTYELKQKVKVHPGEERILSALALDVGHGVRTFDGEVLLSDPERLEEADCMIVIRAVFDDKEHLSEVEEPAGEQEEMKTENAQSSSLDEAISAAVMEKNASDYPEKYDFACCDFLCLEWEDVTADKQSTEHTQIYYGWALYNRYRFSENGIEDVGGGHIPVALTFDKSMDENEYVLKEYWTPRDGSYFESDIREKFPASVAEDAIDSQKYIVQQKQNCYAQAVEYGTLDTDAIIGRLIKTICEPMALSYTDAYIDEHPLEYRELLYYGDYTYDYCTARFRKGGENGLEGAVMSSVCEQLLEMKDVRLPEATKGKIGQEWFDTFRSENAAMASSFYGE